MDIEHLNLANLGNGAAVEKWGEELQKVAENILDPNTDALAKRELMLRVTIKPAKERREASIIISVASKLAAQIAVQTHAFLGIDRQTGQVVIAEHNTQQMALDFARAQSQKRGLLQGEAVAQEDGEEE